MPKRSRASAHNSGRTPRLVASAWNGILRHGGACSRDMLAVGRAMAHVASMGRVHFSDPMIATLHFRGGLTQQIDVPPPPPDAVLFEDHVPRSPEPRSPEIKPHVPHVPHVPRVSDVPQQLPILFRYDSVTTEQGLHYRQDSRWPPRAYVSNRRCGRCQKSVSWYFIRSLWPNELPTDVRGAATRTVLAVCKNCYPLSG